MLYEDRRRAGSFGAVAEQYDRARPSYPSELVDDLLVGGGLQAVLDVGCGSGIASRLFSGRGCQVLGIEPDERMAEVARRSGTEVECSTFERWDSDGRTFDLLVSAQAWHWVDPRIGSAKAASVLRRGGRAALVWNCGRHEPDFNVAILDVYHRLGLDLDPHSILLGQPAGDRFRVTAEHLEATGAFEAVDQRVYSWQKIYSRDEWLDHLPTHSDHQMLAPSRLAELLAAVGELVDSRGGAFSMTYETVALIAARRAG
jgi:SAM-dependent methyltransferase